jgi:hypothetical protein
MGAGWIAPSLKGEVSNHKGNFDEKNATRAGVVMELNSLPSPRPAAAGRRKLIVLAALALVAVAGAAFWLGSDDGTKTELLDKTGEALRDAGLEPLVNAGRGLLAPPPPPPPVHSVGTATPGASADGTLIQGAIPALPDPAAPPNPENEPQADAAAETPPPWIAPKQREDSVIRADFLRDLAGWMVTRYKISSRGGKGRITAGVQSANMRYGTSLRGMGRQGGDILSARASILRYAFNPAMLDALYAVYADRFVDEVARAALAPEQGKALSEEQLDGLYRTYAGFFADLAEVTAGVADLPDLKKRIEQMSTAGQHSIELHSRIMETVFALDETREKDDAAAERKLQAQLADLNARYRSGLRARDDARAALISSIRKGAPAGHLDDDSVLFVARWIERRMEHQADALAAARKTSELLNDLARRFESAAGKAKPSSGGNI